MPVLPFLFDCSYKRTLASTIGFYVSHAVILIIISTVMVYQADSLNAGKRMLFIYSATVTSLIVTQKRLHPGFYAISALSALGGAFGGAIIGLLPAAYLLRKPSNRQT